MLKAAMAGCGFLDSSIQSRKILLLLPFVSAGITISFTNRRMWICPLREGGGQAVPRDDGGGIPVGGRDPYDGTTNPGKDDSHCFGVAGGFSRGPPTLTHAVTSVGVLGEHPPPTTTSQGAWWVVQAEKCPSANSKKFWERLIFYFGNNVSL